MEEETREKIRELARNRSITCSCCGGTNTERKDDLDDDTHFPGVVYIICRSCGHENVDTRKTRSKSHQKMLKKRAKKAE